MSSETETTETGIGERAADRRRAILLFVAAVGIRLIAMSFGHNDDGDAMTRVIHSRLVVDRGDLVPSDVWLPGHFFFLALPYLFGMKDQLYLIILTALVSALAVPLTYYLVKEFFGRKAALLSAIVLAVYSMHVRFSIVTVAEGPSWTFALAGILMFYRYVREGRPGQLAIGCLSMSVACSMRLESWLLPIAFVIGALVHWRFWKQETISPRVVSRICASVAFSLAFPIFWSFYCYAMHGDPLYFQNQIVRTANLRPAALGYALAFWPGLMLFSMGPIVMPLTVYGLIRSLLTNRRVIGFLVFASAFAMLTVFGYGRFVHARYGFCLTMVMLLFVGPGFQALTRLEYVRKNERRLRQLVLLSSCLWLILMPIISESRLGSFSETMHSVTPVPRFDRAIVQANDWLASNLAKEGCIVLHGGVGPGVAWLSLADRWYDTQMMGRYIDRKRDRKQLYFSISLDDLVEIVQSNARGHLVLAVEKLPEVKRELRARLADRRLAEQPAFSNVEFAIFRWGNFPKQPDRIEAATQ